MTSTASPVGEAYKQLIREWRAVLPTQSTALTLPIFAPSQQDGAAAAAVQDLARTHAHAREATYGQDEAAVTGDRLASKGEA